MKPNPLPLFAILVALTAFPLVASAHGGPHVEPVQAQPVERVGNAGTGTRGFDPNEARTSGRGAAAQAGCASCSVTTSGTTPTGYAALGIGLVGALSWGRRVWARRRAR